MKTTTILFILFILISSSVDAQESGGAVMLKSEIKPRTAPPPPPPKPPVNSDTNKINVNIWPSPSTTDFYLMVKSPSEEKINVKLFDLSGRSVIKFEAETEEQIAFGATLESGLYIVNITQGAFEETVKVVKTD